MAEVHSQLENLGTLKGIAKTNRLATGVSIHFSDTRSIQATTIDFIAAEGVTLGVFLEGRPNWLEGRNTMHMVANDEPVGMLWSRPNAIHAKRTAEPNLRTRHLNITFPWDWLHVRLGYDWCEDLASFSTWTPSVPIIAQADLMISAKGQGYSGLQQESFALSMLAEFSQQSAGIACSPTSSRQWKQLQPVVKHIKQNLNTEHSLQSLGTRFGMSRSTLQRLFKDVHGTSTLAFIRAEKMEHARQALAKHGASVAQAGYAVGYNNPSNFSTAFRKHFGYSPKSVTQPNLIKSG